MVEQREAEALAALVGPHCDLSDPARVRVPRAEHRADELALALGDEVEAEIGVRAEHVPGPLVERDTHLDPATDR